MTFREMNGRLLTIARERVGNGEITESQLARLMGISQSHTHNVLKGARKLSPELADAILRQLRLNTEDLLDDQEPVSALPFRSVPLLSGLLGSDMESFDPAHTAGSAEIPAQIVAVLRRPIAVRLGEDAKAAPRFQKGDLVLIDQTISTRRRLDNDAIYVVKTSDGPRIRYVRQGVDRIYVASEESVMNPSRWEPVPVTRATLLSVILGRVMWVSRKLSNSAGS